MFTYIYFYTCVCMLLCRERFRTVMNVVADSYVAAIVERLCRDRLPQEDEADNEYPAAHVLHGYEHGTPDVEMCRVRDTRID